MDRSARLLQRLIDGEASASELSLAQQVVSQDPAKRAFLEGFQSLDRVLRATAIPADRHDHHDLVSLIAQRLPANVPAAHLRISPVEIVYGLMIVVLIGFGFAMVASLNIAPLLHLTVAISSLIAGLVIFTLAGLIRRLEAGLLGSFLRQPIVVGRSDLLIYRAVGAGLVIGGIWLTRLG